jgi:luciferase family oxidoreductase group 1
MNDNRWFTLSVLDLVTRWNGLSAGEAIAETVALARTVGRLGYTRFWLAEHHNTPFQASSAPELLIVPVAAATSTLRVGSGGIMLPNHVALKVVENFRTLEALYPGRIDLGIGRAPGADGLTAMALRRVRQGTGAEDFPEQLSELILFLTGGFADDHPFKRITPAPVVPTTPQLWMLGSSDYGGRVAAQLGLGFAFAHHISPDPAIPVLRAYRRDFQPSEFMSAPRSILAVSAFCADTEQEAEEVAMLLALRWTRMRQGLHAPPPTLEEARSYRYSPGEATLRDAMRARLFAGTVDQVTPALRTRAEEAQVDEIMLLTMTPSLAARQRSYELLAEAFGLQAQ